MKTIKSVMDSQQTYYESIVGGEPARLGDGHSIGDTVRQGDLYITLADAVPSGYIKVDPSETNRQLVPDNGSPGSHHRIASWDGVVMYRPADWGRNEADLRGPCLVLSQPNAIVHERAEKPHGTVHIDGPCTIICTYQRNLNAEGRAVRAMD